MKKEPRPQSLGHRSPDARFWRRMALAVSISMILHIIVAVMMRPSYQTVSDYAIDLEVLEGTPGLPGPPESAEAPAPKPAPAPPQAPPPQAASPATASSSLPGEGTTDAGPADRLAGAPALFSSDGGVQGTAEPGEGGAGICMHDLFQYSQPSASWLLWISMSSFRNTVYQKDLGNILTTYKMTRRLSNATGIAPETDVEGLMVSAQDIFDWRSFQIVASYDSGEDRLRRRLEKSHGATPSFGWLQTHQGWEARLPGEFHWYLTGAGRVMVVTHAPKFQTEQPGRRFLNSRAVREVPLNPFSKAEGADAGPSGPGSSPLLADGTFPQWPEQLHCLTALPSGETSAPPPAETTSPSRDALLTSARSYLAPDPQRHWPVAMLATNDPRAIGIGRNRGNSSPVFLYAAARAYFVDPIRIEGEVHFRGSPEQIAGLASTWRRLALGATRNPFLAMAGLSNLFSDIKIEPSGTNIRLVMNATESQDTSRPDIPPATGGSHGAAHGKLTGEQI